MSKDVYHNIIIVMQIKNNFKMGCEPYCVPYPKFIHWSPNFSCDGIWK